VGCVAVAALATGPIAGAGTISVHDSDQLQAAVASASSGDTIVLEAGKYTPDSTMVVKTNLTITGPTIQGPAGGLPGPYISGANVTGTEPPDIFDVNAGASLTLANVSVRLSMPSATAAIDVFGSLGLENSDVEQNASPEAIYVEQGGSLTATNSTIGGNVAIGVLVDGDASFVNSTIVRNTGTGIFDEDGTTSITNTIVAHNGNGTKYFRDCFAGVTSSTNSIDGDGSCNANITADPRLAQFINANGGPTATDALQAGSPAIDAGQASACPPTDQRHAPRVGTCDIGAFEFGSTPPAPAPTPKSGAGAQPAAGGSTAQPSGTPGGKTAPGSGAPTRGSKKRPQKPATFTASGAIRSKSGMATFRLRGTAGKHAGLLQFDFPHAGIHLRTTKLGTLEIDTTRGTATIGGTALDLKSRLRVTFKIGLVAGEPGRFQIVVAKPPSKSGKPFSLGGRLVSGKVFIA
jgi:hypothetical protein